VANLPNLRRSFHWNGVKRQIEGGIFIIYSAGEKYSEQNVKNVDGRGNKIMNR